MNARARLSLFAVFAALFAMLSPTAIAAPASTTRQYAYVGGGCFWCTEAAYELLPGVVSVVSGYAGGPIPNPTYKQITTGTTGHAEVIRIEFDPTVTSYRAVLDFFWAIHDPTTLNRQGADEGTQYRSIILTTSDQERATAEASRAAAQPGWGNRIVTEIVPLETFYEAEEYHQDYFRKNPNAGYCRVVIKPKLDKLKKHPGVATPAAKTKP
jgi:peptide-methionine (S)-S-oxide reductase